MQKEIPVSRTSYGVTVLCGVFLVVILSIVYLTIEPKKLSPTDIDSWILALVLAIFFIYALLSCITMNSAVTDGTIGWFRPYLEDGRKITRWGKIITYSVPMAMIECWGFTLVYSVDNYLVVMFNMPNWLVITILTTGFVILLWHIYFYLRIAYEVVLRKPRQEV